MCQPLLAYLYHSILVLALYLVQRALQRCGRFHDRLFLPRIQGHPDCLDNPRSPKDDRQTETAAELGLEVADWPDISPVLHDGPADTCHDGPNAEGCFSFDVHDAPRPSSAITG